MRPVSFFILLGITIILLGSCSNWFYYGKVKKNVNEFHNLVNHLDKTAAFQTVDCIYYKSWGDSLSGAPLGDSVIKPFMKKYSLTDICYRQYNDKSFSNAIKFQREYNPIFGKPRIVYYDF